MKTARKQSGKSKPTVRTLDLMELEKIIERASTGPLSEQDRAKLSETVRSLAWMQQELSKKSATLARLRSLFGLNSSEKTDKVLNRDLDPARDPNSQVDDGHPDAESGADPATDTKSKPTAKQKPKGHGRNGHSDYAAASRVQVPHESLQAGDPCPECPPNKRGKVYTQQAPKVLVRVTGQAPIFATIYELERLRCNLCGEVFTAKSPSGVGEEKYDAKAASMIGLLKYGSGLPFNRLERLQGDLRIPLPAATQWEIIEQAADDLTTVHKELIRQAAQGRLLHNDDTSMRVLELRKQIDELVKTGETDRTGIFSTGVVSELAGGQRLALYFTGRNHAGENLTDLLAHRSADLDKPMQMCDGLDHNLPKDFKTIVANCLTHARRKFVDIVVSFPSECRYVLETFRDVYANDAIARERAMSADERLKYHQEHSAPLMREFEEWARTQLSDKLVEPNSVLGKAIRYMTKRWDRLTLFLREAGAPLDNNIAYAERGISDVVVEGRARFAQEERQSVPTFDRVPDGFAEC